METLNKFSNNYKNSLKIAAGLAKELSQEFVNPVHLFYGLVSQKGSVGAELLNSLEIKSEEVKKSIAQSHQLAGQVAIGVLPLFSDQTKKVIQKSVQIAYSNRHKYIGTEHLLAAILETGSPEIKRIFEALKISENEVLQKAVAVLKSVSKLPDLTEIFKNISKTEEYSELNDSQGGVLDIFGVNLTSEKIQKKIDPVIGRNEEITRIIQILCRRNKNNPLILGHPGVGKTAIVEGLAKKILAGDVPEMLQHKKIYSLDLTATIAGTMYRGEFENRLKQIIDEVKNRPDVILFIDEIHNIVGAGSASGSLDTANILKPALARGDIRCLGATTFEDYRRTIENDPALARRFQPVKISEPSAEETKKILQGIRQNFESFHQIKVSDLAINAAISLSQRYLPEKFLPDKAIDLIDEAGASLKIHKEPSNLDKKIKATSLTLNSLKREKENAVLSEQFAKALELKQQTQELEARLIKLKTKRQQSSAGSSGEVSSQDIARVVAKMTGIPAENLIAPERRQALQLESKLQALIIGQNEAIKNIADFIKRSKAGLTNENKPLASFIFVGPSGVGKTYAAKMLANLIFDSPESLVRIDMSEYSEKFNISKLIGAPAGYVGYKESGQLTEKIKHKPYSLILFDEIEKAHPEIFNLLLQVLDDGYLTDAAGTKINFRNTVIVMTSNLGSQLFKKNQRIGFNQQKDGLANSVEKEIFNEVRGHFRLEFLNRIDKVIYFNPLDEKSLQQIVSLQLQNLADKLKKRDITIKFNRALMVLLAKRSQTDNQGARAISKIIQEHLESPLSQQILEDKIKPGDTILVKQKNGIINLSVQA